MYSKFKNFKEIENYSTKLIDMMRRNHEGYRNTPVFPINAKVGFLRELLPKDPPLKESSFDEIIRSTESYILPNILKWQHPRNFGYFQSSISSPMVLAEMLRSSINPVGFQWNSSPASTELENILSDWTVKMLDLPEKFLLKNKGGGFISSTVSEGIFFSVQYSKYKKMKELGLSPRDPQLNKFVAYMSDYSFHVLNRSFFLTEIINVRKINSKIIGNNSKVVLDVDSLQKQIEQDKKDGLIPFFYGGTIGSTNVTADDPVEQISQVCKEHKMNLLVDAAYASMYLVLPEIRKRFTHDFADVNCLTVNYSKAGLCGIGSSFLFIDDKDLYVEAISGKPKKDIELPEYLKNELSQSNETTDYSDWSLEWGRRFEALKIYWVISRFGIEGLREYIKQIVEVSDYLVEKIKNKNARYELLFEKNYSLVCFRIVKIKGKIFSSLEECNEFNSNVANRVKSEGFMFLNTGSQSGMIFIRFNIGSYETTKDDIDPAIDLLDRLVSEEEAKH